jgi:glutamate/tyrosine decarboxylase-like PLP-dependent enzyme
MKAATEKTVSENEILDEAVLDQAHRLAAEYLRTLPQRHVGARATREELLRGLAVPLSENGDEAARVIDALASQAERGAIGSAGPRYFGFVIGGSLPVTVAADWLTTTWDQNAGIFVTSPLSSVAEEVARGWLLDLFGLPRDAGLGFTTGCQMANFTCIAAARHAVMRNAGWNVEENGLVGGPHVNIVLSAESHVTIHVALRMLGFGTKNALIVPTDEQGRMIVAELRRTLSGLTGPTIVCAQAGNVNSGALTRSARSPRSLANMAPGFMSTAPSVSGPRRVPPRARLSTASTRRTPGRLTLTNG